MALMLQRSMAGSRVTASSGRSVAPRPSIAALAPCTTSSMCSPGRRLCVRVQAQSARTLSTVKMIIRGRKLQVTDAIRAYIEDKLTRALGNYTQEIKEVDVTISARGGDTGTHGKKQQKVDVTIFTLRNGVVRVEDGEETLYASIDIVTDKIERKMKKIKELAIAKGKWPGRAGPKDQGVALEEQDFKEYQEQVQYEIKVSDEKQALDKQFAELNKAFPPIVLRSKVVKLEPMTAQDAIEAIEALGHDFFLWRDAESQKVQVLYRRQTGGYGVLIPE